jgi:3'-phosphoadenosine 5'-phosphosulfate sulfotransferase (PAPS reductase)/FAD synthetase
LDNVTAVFNDTGWDHPVTYEYLDYLRSTLNIKIHSTLGATRRDGTPAYDLVSLIRAQGRFPFGLGRFCTSHLKQSALRIWYRDNLFNPDEKYEFWFGMRTQESSQRAKKYDGITYDDLFDMGDMFPKVYNKKLRATIQVRLPVIEWSEQQIFDFLELAGVDRNPLYYEGTNDRVGCYPCLLAGNKVQTKMFATDVGKQRLKIIKQLEIELGQKYEMFDTDQGSCELCKI